MNQEQIEAVRRDISALRNGLLYPWQHDEVQDRILAALDHLTKANEELRAEVELAKQEGVTETLQQIDCLTGGDGEYRLSTCPDRNCPDEDAMCKKIVARFDDLRATIDRLTKERDQAVAEADPELLTIAWMDGSHRSAKAARDEIKRLTTRLSAMQEAIDEAVRRADTEAPFKTHVIVSDVVEPLRPFATKPEPEADPLAGEWRDKSEPSPEGVPVLAEYNEWNNPKNPAKQHVVWWFDNNWRPYPETDAAAYVNRWKHLPARGGRVVFDGREG